MATKTSIFNTLLQIFTIFITIFLINNINKNVVDINSKLVGMVKEDSTLKAQLQQYPAALPIISTNISKVTSVYSERIDPFTKKKKMHWGIDYSAPYGTKVYATGDGEVEFTGVKIGFGDTVKLDHKNNFESLYGHLSKIFVVKGQKVKRGDVLGLVGSTGMSTGNHLHYEIFYGYKPINPEIFFKKIT